MDTKLHRLSRVRTSSVNKEADSVRRSREGIRDERGRGIQVLMEAQWHHSAMYRYRLDRDRNKRYNFGDQLNDVVCVDGVKMTEEQYIKKQGGVPLITNLINRITNKVVGTFREQQSEPICLARDRDEQREAETLSTLLQYNMQLNRIGELYASSMKEYVIGGLVAHRKYFGWRNERNDCWTDIVPPNMFIIDSNMTDLRGWDCSFVGQLHDLSYEEVCSELAKTPSDYNRIADIYKYARDMRNVTHIWQEFGYRKDALSVDFLAPTDMNRCRVIEVWRKESKARYRCHDYNSGEVYKIEVEDAFQVDAENRRRLEQAQRTGIPADEVPLIDAEWFVDTYWRYYYLSPLGDILSEGETPYEHKGHPFVFKAYPFIDGEIHSMVSDLIPLQRYTNNLIMLHNMIVRSSAKGLLVVPRGSMSGLTEEQIGSIWAKPNGVLVIDSDKYGNLPQQIASNSTNIGINEMLSLQLKFFEDVSGVNATLQGKASFSGESGSHAQVMAMNAATSLLDVIESFNDFQGEAAYKDVKNIQQFYDEKKVLNIVGRSAAGVDINPKKVLGTEVDISISPSKKTPVYRAIANDFYMALFQQQAIGLEELLESVADIPYADELLQRIRSQRQAAEMGQMPEGVPPELIGKVRQGLNANPTAVEQLQQAVGGMPQGAA